MLSLIFVALAAMCFSIMDVLANHYPRSVFKDENASWWNPKVSYKNRYVDWDKGIRSERLLNVFSDAWRTFKFLTIGFFFLAVLAMNFTSLFSIEGHPENIPIWLFMMTIVYYGVYMLFYKKILIRNGSKVKNI